MLNLLERKELVRVAKLYYVDGLTQAEIAKKIGVSRPVISRLLQKAKDYGVVEIHINDETVSTVELEQQLKGALSVKEIIVVPVQESNHDELIKQLVAKAAANCASALIKDTNKVGISWGETLFHLVDQFPFQKYNDVTVYPLIGGIGRNRAEIHSNQLAYELAKKMGGKYEFLYAPAIAETIDLQMQLISSTEIHALLEEVKHIDIALIGIGNPFDSTIVNIGYLKHGDIMELKENQAIGDINSRFINYNGDEIPTSINNKVIGINLADLRKVPIVMAVASGIKKAEAILGALRGDYIDILVIDEPTAKKILFMITDKMVEIDKRFIFN
jgi:DNA-binding transcriptional regulator LsrR (DeoR family)